MESKTLKTIQTLMKIGKIISGLAFIFGIIQIVACILGIICLATIPENFVDEILKLFVKVEDTKVLSNATMYVSLSVGIVFSIGEIIIAHYDYEFFKYELSIGTPFDFEVARRLKIISIKQIVVPIICTIVATIIYEIFKATVIGVEYISFGDEFSLSIGVMFLIFSFVCKYGAEIRQQNNNRQ